MAISHHLSKYSRVGNPNCNYLAALFSNYFEYLFGVFFVCLFVVFCLFFFNQVKDSTLPCYNVVKAEPLEH